MGSPTRTAIDWQRDADSGRGERQAVLLARMTSVIRAQHALVQRQDGALEALRGGLVDLAAISEQLAAEIKSQAS